MILSLDSNNVFAGLLQFLLTSLAKGFMVEMLKNAVDIYATAEAIGMLWMWAAFDIISIFSTQNSGDCNLKTVFFSLSKLQSLILNCP